MQNLETKPMKTLLEDVNIESFTPMAAPAEIKALVPMTEKAAQTVAAGRAAVRAVLDGSDNRFLVITGPCSVHDPKAALEYAQKLSALSRELGDAILFVMRVYFEKPRTVAGWKGFVNDPRMDGSFRIAEGMTRARELMRAISEMGLPLATEALDPSGPQYLGDFVSWYAIGARTAESQTHREMASGLSAPWASRTARTAISRRRSTPSTQAAAAITSSASTKTAAPR